MEKISRVTSEFLVAAVGWIFKFNFYFLLESLSTEYVDHFYFVHSSVDGHFLCFQVLAMVNILGVQDCQPVTFFFFLD